ncbi:hypothetical protein [Streptomyces scabiei]|uniref:hypothetical protein n=2 Tax=Streptomyces scabiei TaxID=1930 RepID=UPI0007658516|nr:MULTISPECIES: hypothetical protein [Streptomyces]MBP5872122.1 hypothetical protein [Streptomyces sp. LBUM 1485]MBP5918651.1 hypothetical protein [Streptomyces sp. LBUM 1486]MDX2536123.1 hypothetical protein [Streptomyces scabiei]MDX2797192.1 hypothetical protein [Streptomyces scabiei]MDX2857387.1 hypothetical protein [Streptomyces scabiei]
MPALTGRALTGRHVNEPEPRPAAWLERPDQAAPTPPTALINIVVAQATFIAALMFYLGVIYTSAYYGHFHLSPFALGFGFGEFVLHSLHLATFPVLVGATVLLLAVAAAGHRPRQESQGGLMRGVRRLASALARHYPIVVAVGLLLLVLWWQWQVFLPYRWLGPLLVGFGLLLGAVGQTGQGGQGSPWETALLVLAAGLFLLWAVTLVSGQLGERHARNDAREVILRTGLVVHSAQPLSLTSRSAGLRYLDLGEGVHLRHRYWGLRLVVERAGRYYAVPIGWRARTDNVFVLREGEGVRIELTPGVQ